MKKPNQQGLSMIEAIIAMGVLGVVAFSFLSWIHGLYMSANFMNGNIEIQNTMTNLKSAFGDDDNYCQGILGGQPLSPTAETALSELKYSDINKTKLDLLLKVGDRIQPKSSVIAKDIRLVPSFPLDANTIVADLQVTFQRSNSVGATEVVRTLPIFADVRSGAIYNCSTSPLNTVTINQRLCDMMYQGWSPYDRTIEIPPGSDKAPCNVTTGKFQWFTGDANQASCGPGFKLAVTQDHPNPDFVACEMDASEGFDFPPRTYVSGFIDDGEAIPNRAKVNFANNACDFAYMAGADPATMKTRVKCVPLNEEP